MERYNLPLSGIEVTINEEETGTEETASPLTPPTQTGTEEDISTAEPEPPGRILPPKNRRSRPLHYIATRSLMLVSVFAVIGNIPVHSNITGSDDYSAQLAVDTLRDDAAEQLELATGNQPNSQELNLPGKSEIETYAGHAVEPLPSAREGDWELHQIARGDTLADILSPLKVSTTEAALTADETVKKELTNLKAGNKILIQINDDKVEQLIYATGKRKAFIVSAQNDGYTGKWDNELFEEQHNRIAFTIRNPYHYEASKAGLPKSISRELVSIFKSQVNFRSLKIGDQVSTIFEDYFYQSERIYTGKILAAEFNHRDNIYQKVRFVLSDDRTMYLSPEGDLALKEVAFARYPLKGRFSSGFGYRRHPVLGTRRMHSGIDIAAPHGTPIHATGDGEARFVGRKGSYGKMIELRHASGITTRYGHMSQYKKNLGVGARVKRGDVIGYVGSTGRSTGNHVHYEFRVNNKPHNPRTVSLPTKGVLTASEMKDFKRLAKNMSYQLIQLRETASIDRNVRRQFGG
ncbi:MAG: peptidoglycan DD-metalloendopeptidase family protein [Thiolinea sp.]